MDWQSYTALGVVVITLGMFTYRLTRTGKTKAACGKSCGCGVEKKS
jgi:hypothetical protein